MKQSSLSSKQIDENDIKKWLHEDDLEVDCEIMTDSEFFRASEKEIQDEMADQEVTCDLQAEATQTQINENDPKFKYRKGLEYVNFLTELFAEEQNTEQENMLLNIKEKLIDKILDC